MENLDLGCGHGRNFDHLTIVILKFWPWSWSKHDQNMTNTPGRRPNGQKIIALPPPKTVQVYLECSTKFASLFLEFPTLFLIMDMIVSM